MKKYIVLLLCLITVVPIYAQVFTDLFADKTLRIDYIFNGNASEQSICLDGLSSLPAWDESIIWQSFHCKATDRLLCVI